MEWNPLVVVSFFFSFFLIRNFKFLLKMLQPKLHFEKAYYWLLIVKFKSRKLSCILFSFPFFIFWKKKKNFLLKSSGFFSWVRMTWKAELSELESSFVLYDCPKSGKTRNPLFATTSLLSFLSFLLFCFKV